MSILNPAPEHTDSFGNIITLTESGQMGQHQDSRWSGTVRIDRDQLNHEDMVRSIIEHHVREGHIFPVGIQRPFAAPYFTHFGQKSDEPKVWYFTVVRDFLD